MVALLFAMESCCFCCPPLAAALGVSPCSGTTRKQQPSCKSLSCKQTSPNLTKSPFFPSLFSRSLSNLPNSVGVVESTAPELEALPTLEQGAAGTEIALSCVHHLICTFLSPCPSREIGSKAAPGRGLVVGRIYCNVCCTLGRASPCCWG